MAKKTQKKNKKTRNSARHTGGEGGFARLLYLVTIIFLGTVLYAWLNGGNDASVTATTRIPHQKPTAEIRISPAVRYAVDRMEQSKTNMARHAQPAATRPAPETRNHADERIRPLIKNVATRPSDSAPKALMDPQPQPTWLKNAVPVTVPKGNKVIAIVIDDLGIDHPRTRRAMKLPAPITMAFLPYPSDVRSQAKTARDKGHELIIHMPMEPVGSANPGPNALRIDLPDDELRKRVTENLARMDGYVGINNHMGSAFTKDSKKMPVVLQILKQQGLLYLDSKTISSSVGGDMARALGMPYANRDVFLDHYEDRANVDKALAHTEAVAKRNGFAVAIGHPKDNTLDALEAWIPTLQSRGFTLVPISYIARLNSPAGNADRIAMHP